MNINNDFPFHAALDEMVDAIVITNGSSGEIIEVSKSCADLLGYNKSELTGSVFFALLDDKTKGQLSGSPHNINMFDNILTNRHIRTKNGMLIPVDMTINTFSGKSSHYVMTSLRDVRQRIKSEQDVLAMNNKLNESIASKDKLFSIIAHDLKNPMMALMGLSEFLTEDSEEIGNDEISQMANSINKLSKDTYELLDNLLNWAQVQTKGITADKINVNLSYLAANIIEALAPAAGIKKVNIINQITPGYSIHADENMIKTIIRNLISNSIKFTPEGKALKISAVEIDNAHQIIIEDEGIGMEQNYIDDLFKIDIKTTRDGTNKEKGTGLGLLICYEFVKLHDGEIIINSQSGKGSKFIIQLPKP